MYFIIKLKRKMAVAFACCILAIFGAVCVTASVVQEEKVIVPVIMYHSILNDSKYFGEYVISESEFEKDLIYLKNNGYTAITGKDLLNYVENSGELPEKPIMLTFDDGYYNNYLYAYPLAQKYNTKIAISPIGYWSDQYSKEGKLSPYYSHCTWDQIEEMHESGIVEFGNHTYNLHKSDSARLGSKRLAGESMGGYTEMLKKDVGEMEKKLFEVTGAKSTFFTYPFGAISEGESEIIADMGFKITFSCESKLNIVTRDSSSVSSLGRFLRTQNDSVEKLLK